MATNGGHILNLQFFVAQGLRTATFQRSSLMVKRGAVYVLAMMRDREKLEAEKQNPGKCHVLNLSVRS
jgi:hypothetical protein